MHANYLYPRISTSVPAYRKFCSLRSEEGVLAVYIMSKQGASGGFFFWSSPETSDYKRKMLAWCGTAADSVQASSTIGYVIHPVNRCAHKFE